MKNSYTRDVVFLFSLDCGVCGTDSTYEWDYIYDARCICYSRPSGWRHEPPRSLRYTILQSTLCERTVSPPFFFFGVWSSPCFIFSFHVRAHAELDHFGSHERRKISCELDRFNSCKRSISWVEPFLQRENSNLLSWTIWQLLTELFAPSPVIGLPINSPRGPQGITPRV